MDTFEFVPTSNEVLHEKGYDILENNRQTTIDREEMQRLMDIVRQETEKGIVGNPLPSWVRSEKSDVILLDNPEKPKYVAKNKWITPDNGQFQRAVAIDRNIATENELYGKNTLYATASILSEMSLSSDITKIVKLDSIQKTFKELGFDSFDYVEPLMGIIDRDTGEKRIIYKYIDGVDMLTYYSEKGESSAENYKAIRHLSSTFLENGIVPEDISSYQFMISEKKDGKKELHLIDAEMYFRRKNNRNGRK